ncbi:MAG: hypothetical protein ACREOF_15870 [Gemmatimonadales bacterium]
MTGTLPVVPNNSSASPGSSLARYGAAEKVRLVYQATQSPTSKPEENAAGGGGVSDSNPPAVPADQFLSLPTIPSGSKLTPPSHAFPRKQIKRPKVKHTAAHLAQYRIAGELFYVEVKGRRTYIRHPRWSLMGAGMTLADAEVALFEEARACGASIREVIRR